MLEGEEGGKVARGKKGGQTLLWALDWRYQSLTLVRVVFLVRSNIKTIATVEEDVVREEGDGKGGGGEEERKELVTGILTDKGEHVHEGFLS